MQLQTVNSNQVINENLINAMYGVFGAKQIDVLQKFIFILN